MVDAEARVPVSLLVVPNYHRRGRVSDDRAFVRAIDARIAGGDEVALHGYHHLDEGPSARNPADWCRRRLRTLSEGELAATGIAASAECIARGRAELMAAGWNVTGFVPPAWLLGSAAREALNAFPFAYTATRGGFHRLPDWDVLSTTTLSYAAFARWRRALSRPVLDHQLRHAAPDRPLRLAIHPVDARYPAVLQHWRQLLARALDARVPMTAAAIVEQHWHRLSRGGCAQHPSTGLAAADARSTRPPPGKASRRAAVGAASPP